MRSFARLWRSRWGLRPRAPNRLRSLLRSGSRSFACIALAGLALGGCVTVAPYEREHLASPAMNAELEEGESSFQAHVFDSREGSSGGTGSTGGGCGCN